ncbi:MAG: hypothetical protein ACYC99_15900, partial [Candidatus Geothermincolia bacterium]
MAPNDASDFTRDSNACCQQDPLLNWSDTQDWDFARRGFIAKLDDPVIRNADGKAVWDLGQY